MSPEEALAKATPRPWAAHIWPRKRRFATPDPSIEGSGHTVAIVSGAPETRGEPDEGDANAALIVLAVNAYEHDQETIGNLVKVCQAYLDWLDSKGTMPAESLARAALARAEKEAP